MIMVFILMMIALLRSTPLDIPTLVDRAKKE